MSLSKIFFKYRSYTPIPFLIIMIIFENANILSIIIGLIIAAAGELIRLWGVSYAGSETRTTGDVGGSYLVISGPFAFVRNPLYVGNILMYLGIGIMSYALFPYLQIGALIFFVLQYYYIVKAEEGYLKETFGEQYKNYFENVPRFFPRFTRYKNQEVAQPEYDIKAGLKSESRTFQAFGLVVLIIIVKWIIREYFI